MKRIATSILCIVMVISLSLPVPGIRAYGAQLTDETVAATGGLASGDLAADSADIFTQSDGDTGGAGNKSWEPAVPHERPNLSLSDSYTAQSVGFGGHGAVFDPVISPFDSDTMIVDCDMGGVYVTHDGGGNWDMKNCGGRIWDMQADPTREGVFYAAGSGLWRSQDNGDSWQLLWPNPSTVYATPTKLNQKRTYYCSTDSYPDTHDVDALRVDPADGQHLIAITSAAANAADGKSYWRRVFESFDGGASFTCLAEFQQKKDFKQNATDGNFVNTRVFLEQGDSPRESRVVIANPDGIYEVSRSAADVREALTALYEPPAEVKSLTIQDTQQVIDGDGVHYIVLENMSEEWAREKKCRVKLWHTTDFSDASAAVDLTDELVACLPRHYNENDKRTGADYEITMHNVMAVTAPSMERMYLTYRTRDATGGTPTTTYQGANGLVIYDAGAAEGSRFYWAYGLRLWWSGEDAGARITPDANMIMARAHCDSMYTWLGFAVDPNDDRRILMGTHDGVMYSPNIDADVGTKWGRDNVNIYPRYATYVADNPDNPTNVSEGFMKSNGLEVTVTTRIAQDPFDANHVLLGMDDAGVAQSFDGAKTWTWRYTTRPAGATDTCREMVFDEGEQGVVYAFWHANGGRTTDGRKDLLTVRGLFARSKNGGKTWETSNYGAGLPDACAGTRIVVVYPRDEQGNITAGDRTLYISTMGHGFFVSHDSGRSFEPMNTGIPTVSCTASETVTVDAIWARDILVGDDGRIFGMTQYSSLGPANSNGNSTYHSTQDPDTYGNVWEWDASANEGAGSWVRLPFNTAGSAYENGLQVRQPRAMCYDAQERTLYVAGVSCIGYSGTLWDNFGGGMYVYQDAADTPVGQGTACELEGTQELLGASRNMTGVAFDANGRLWMSTEDGSAYVRDGWGEGGWTQVCADVPSLGQGLDPVPDGTVFLTTTGVSSVRMTEVTPVWGEWQAVEAPTCTEEGVEQRVDTVDSRRTETRVADPLGHDWESDFTVDVAATATTAGSKSIHCTRCSERKDVTEIPAIGTASKPSSGSGSSSGSTPGSTSGSTGRPGGWVAPGSGSSSSSGSGTSSKTENPASESISSGGGSGSEGSSSTEESAGAQEDASSQKGAGSQENSGSQESPAPAAAPAHISISGAKVTLSATSVVYSGKAAKPAVKSVELRAPGNSSALVEGRDYTVSYSANKNVGTAKVKVTGIGAYGDSKTVPFKILPKGATISKLVSSKQGVTVKWKRQLAQTSGYQVQYGLYSDFMGSRLETVAKPKATSLKLSKLAVGKRYYVRIRTLKKIGKTTYYSDWSKAKAVVTKK